MKGVVYCLTNPSIPDYVKIGKTTNLEQRLKDLDNTSVPLPFECIYAVEVHDHHEVEKLLHQAFADMRTRKTREFFEVGAQRVIAAMKLTRGLDVTPTTDTVEDNDTQIALDKARNKRTQFNFEMVNIPPKTELYFYDDPNITCTVINKRQILFNGEETSLTRAAGGILIERKKEKGEPIPEWLRVWSVQGTLYWYLNGESMIERRKRMESES